jgi:hypothetical protein
VSLSDEQFREQLVDYLYGELSDARRAAFEAALAESADRRAELEAYRATLRHARSGLAALSEDPPARLRSAVLDAERASKVVSRKAWYRRSAALVPALAAAAALAFAVLSPRRDHQMGPEYEVPPLPAAPVQPAAPAPPPPSQPAPVDRASTKAGAPAKERRRAVDKEPAKKKAGADGFGAFAEPPAGWGGGAQPKAEPERAAEAESKDDRASGGAPAAAPARAAAPAPARDAREEHVERAPAALVERAKALIDARRWADAIIAYRELQQRFPRDERVPAWRSEQSRAARALSAAQQF